jgi:hypothetical protein
MWALDDRAQAATRGAKRPAPVADQGLLFARMHEMVLSIVLALKFSDRDRNGFNRLRMETERAAKAEVEVRRATAAAIGRC